MRTRTIVALTVAGLLLILLYIPGTPLNPLPPKQWQLESVPFFAEAGGYAAFGTILLALVFVFLDLKHWLHERRNERAGQTN
jgi:hypothetical protein